MAFDKTTIIQNAQKFTIKGQIDKAIEEWQKIVKESPNDGNTFNTIGDLYLKKNNYQEAISSYLKAAKAFDQAGFSLKTIAVYKKIIKIDPENIEIQVKLADLDAERGLVGNAIEEYLKVVRHYSKTGLPKESISIYKKIINLDPSNMQMRLMLASLCEKESEKKEAVDQYIEISNFFRSQSKFLEGADILKRALALDPGHTQAAQLLKECQTSKNSEPPFASPPSPDLQSLNPVSETDSEVISFQEFSMTDEVSGVKKEAVKPFAPIESSLPAPPLSEDSDGEKLGEEDSLLDSSADIQSEGIDLSAFDTSLAPVPSQDLSEITEIPSLPGMDDEKVKEKLAEGEFYTQQGLMSEAKIIYETILKYYPKNVLAKSKLDEILNHTDEAGPPVGAGFEQVFSEQPDLLLNEIPVPSSPVSSESSKEPSDQNGFAPGTVKLKTTILDKTENTDFINLMGELEGEFKEEIRAPSDDSVQDDDFGKIIKEFQKGIQANIGEKDFETHFDLGVAYKEMGLRTEAIGEFQISIKGGPRTVDSAILLSQCYLEEGLPKLAVEQLNKTIQLTQLNQDQIHSLKYELANLYELQEQNEEALNVLSDIYKENVNYRDVARKISQIRQKTS